MPEPRFFRLIKSANSLIFFAVGLLLLSVLGYVAYKIFQDTVRDRTVSSVANVSSSAQSVKTQVTLGTFAPIEGTPYYLAPVSTEQNYRQDYYDKAASSNRNYLVLNLQDKSTVRIAPTNNWLFLNAEVLGQKNKTGSVSVGQGLMFTVVKADTNGDQRLTESDQRAIALADVSGKNYTELIPQVDSLLGTFQPKPNNLVLAYTTNHKNFISEINISTRQIIVTKELPALD